MSELIDDNALLDVDDDELDYDLEKDEEDALLADPDNFDEQYEDNQNYDEGANEEDILDIDSNVRLDEVEEDVTDPILQDETQPTTLQEEDEEDFQEQKERNRFNSERTQNQAIHRLTSNEIPDSLEKVAVQPFNNTNNYQRNNNNNNNRFHRGRGRGRGRNFNNIHTGNNRPSVFGRVGNFPAQLENKKVLINPHFRGNVQVNENARLVWDQNSTGINQQHPRFPNNPVIPVAPFQAHPSPWVVPPYNEPNNGFNPHNNYQEQPPQPPQYNNQPPGQDLRPLMSMNNQFAGQNQPGNFRGREVRFNQANPPPQHQGLINNQPNFNQQRNFIQIPQQPQQQQQRPPLLNQPNIPPLLPLPQQQQQQHHHHQQPQQFVDQQFINQQFPPQNQFQHQYPQPQQQPQPQVFNNNQAYDQFQQQNYNYNYAKPTPPPIHGNYQQASAPPPAAPQNFNHNQMGGYHPAPEQFQQTQQYENNRQFNRNANIQQARAINRGGFNQVNNINRTPPKRRPFEQKNNHAHNINNQNLGERDMSKKKRRSLELSNLHEVPTVDMPDTTTTTIEDKGEEEDEETKAYRKKIEEQKKLREKIVQQKEERRKMAAASKQQQQLQQQQQNSNATIKTVKTQQQNKKQMQSQPQLKKKNNLMIQRQMNEQPQQQPLPQRIVMMKQSQQPQQPQQHQQIKPNRRVVLKASNNKEITTTTSAIENNDRNLSSFLSNRKVISATSGAGGDLNNKSVNLNEGLIETPIVVVSNLAASTTDVKIRSMCQGIGPIQTIEMIPNSRQATITFKNILSAHKFFKKFQRKIVDLSMIQVTLEALT